MEFKILVLRKKYPDVLQKAIILLPKLLSLAGSPT